MSLKRRAFRILGFFLTFAISLTLVPISQVSAATVPFKLNATESYIHWPMPNSTWDNKNTWHQVGSPGTALHKGSDHFAQDWLFTPQLSGCGQNFLSPIEGTVIFTGWKNQASGAQAYGNQVILRATANTNFALRIAHLQQFTVSVGDYIFVGDKLGVIGNTGTTECHPHISLYKNITSTYSSTQTGIQRLQQGLTLGFTDANKKFSTKFLLNATPIACTTATTPTQLITKINTANTKTTETRICLTPNATYSFANAYGALTALPKITSKITIEGKGATLQNSSSNPSKPFRIMYLEPTAKVRLRTLYMKYAYLETESGGSIYNNGGQLTITNGYFDFSKTFGIYGGSAIDNANGGILRSSNTKYWNGDSYGSGSGGAIANQQNSTTYSTNDNIQANHAANNGGGIYNRGTLIVDGTKFIDDNANNHGGAIFSYEGNVTIKNALFLRSTVWFNAFGLGGAIYNNNLSTLTVTNSRFYQNTAPVNGDSIYNLGPINASSGNCIAGNPGGPGASVQNNSGSAINFKSNWWGAANGPAPSGSGDSVSSNVDFANFLTSAPGSCNLSEI